MDNITAPSPEEMKKLVEKAQKELQEQLAKMTPEEREQAETRAKKMIEEDQIRIQNILNDASKIAEASAAKEAPKLCRHCGAAASGGKFCEYCGMPL